MGARILSCEQGLKPPHLPKNLNASGDEVLHERMKKLEKSTSPGDNDGTRIVIKRSFVGG